jgi:hypothetical protein
MGAYPSFVEPGAFLLEISGGVNFLGSCYCLARALKRAFFKNIFFGKFGHTDEALIEVMSLELGFGHPFGPGQKLEKLGSIDGLVVPKFDTSTTILDSLYSLFLPHGALTPPTNKPINIIYDRL